MKKNILFVLFSWFWVLDLNAQSFTIDRTKVMNFFQNQEYEEAISYLLPGMSLDSDNVEALGFLGYANYQSDNIPEAEKYFQKIYGLDSNNISAIAYLSNIYAVQKTPAALLLTYRLISIQPAKSSYYRQMGNLFRKLKQEDSALLYYREAYHLSKGDIKSSISLADLLIDKKNFLSADTILDLSMSRDSMNSRLMELRIRSAYEQKDYEGALIPGERLMLTDGIFASGLTQLALSYYFLKKYSDCIRVCQFLENQQVYSESLFFYEAKAWSKLKDYEKSNDLLKKCIQMAVSATAETYYYDLGENFEALRQFKKAISQYDTAYYLFKNPLMKYNCGRIAETNLTNKALAKKYFAIYLSIAKPSSADEKRAYEYVKAKWGRQVAK